MSRKIQIFGAIILVLGLIGAVIYKGFESTVFYHTPEELLATPNDFQHRPIRIGAMVVPNSSSWDAENLLLTFEASSGAPEGIIKVSYNGLKPDMFREGQGVVAQGIYKNGVLEADELLVKHSEEYNLAEAHQSGQNKIYETLIDASSTNVD